MNYNRGPLDDDIMEERERDRGPHDLLWFVSVYKIWCVPYW